VSILDKDTVQGLCSVDQNYFSCYNAKISGSSSVGRARPCQGDKRFPSSFVSTTPRYNPYRVCSDE
jgi:hypothetical protein